MKNILISTALCLISSLVFSLENLPELENGAPVKVLSPQEAIAALESSPKQYCTKPPVITNGITVRDESEVNCMLLSSIPKWVPPLMYSGKLVGILSYRISVPPDGAKVTAEINPETTIQANVAARILESIRIAKWPSHNVAEYRNPSASVTFSPPRQQPNKSIKADAIPARP